MSCARSDNFSANMLIDNEADVDHVDPKTGMTPIMLCAAANNLNMVERLIDEGAFLTNRTKALDTASSCSLRSSCIYGLFAFG